MRKIYLVPNLVTTGNIFCGFYSITEAIRGEYLTAAWAIIAAAVFDAMDGRIARLAKATSAFGVQYDSLSDLISFGVAPGILLYLWQLQPFSRLGMLAAFLFVVCGALRLARFNVNSAFLPKGFFQGLPIPMAAGIVATFIIFSHTVDLSVIHVQFQEYFVLGLAFALALLMVSTLKFPSFKEINWKSRSTFGYLALGVVSMLLVAVKPEVTLFLLLSAYVTASMLWNLYRSLFRRLLGQKPVGVQKPN
jgi:CDP-diacylglycerol--serine O-phosphatidyltransferase